MGQQHKRGKRMDKMATLHTKRSELSIFIIGNRITGTETGISIIYYDLVNILLI